MQVQLIEHFNFLEKNFIFSYTVKIYVLFATQLTITCHIFSKVNVHTMQLCTANDEWDDGNPEESKGGIGTRVKRSPIKGVEMLHKIGPPAMEIDKSDLC